jgi:hypothetical protein
MNATGYVINAVLVLPAPPGCAAVSAAARVPAYEQA